MSNPEIIPVLHQATFNDADQASNLLSSAYATVRLEPLVRAQFDFVVSGISLPDIHIYRSCSMTGLRFTSVGYFDGFTFSSMRRGALEVDAAKSTFKVSRGENLAIDAQAVDTLQMTQNSSFCGLAISADAIHKALEDRILDVATRRITLASSQTSTAIHRSYGRISDILHDGLCADGHLQDNPLAVSNLQHALINLIIYGVEHNYSGALSRSAVEAPAVVRKAIDYMHAHAHLPITTTDIARELGIGLRSLQLSFQRWAETTPHHHLRAIRLKLARRDILDGAATVGVIAKHWGFNSPGEFARLYQMAFGEKPTVTIRETSR